LSSFLFKLGNFLATPSIGAQANEPSIQGRILLRAITIGIWPMSLYNRELKLVTSIKKGTASLLITAHEKLMLRKRSLVKTAFDYLKNKFQLEHTRHRSPYNFIQYQLKPSIVLASKIFFNP
jgi:hypothetical protein